MIYENQFYIAERKVCFPLYRGKPFKGFKGKHYFSGFCSFDAALVQRNFPSLSVGEEVRYFICDGYGCPVGESYRRDYSFLGSVGISFPNTHGNKNGFPFYDDAESLLEKIKIYFSKARDKTKRKTHKSSIQTIYEEACLSQKAEREMSLNVGLSERAKRRSLLTEFAREVYVDPLAFDEPS